MSLPQEETRPLNAPISLLEPDKVTHVRKKRKLQAPKLSILELTDAKAIASIFSVGKSTSEENKRHEGRSHARKLATVLRRAGRWAATIAPQHTLPQFVIAARALASKRELRSLISNVRLAQLRGIDVEDERRVGQTEGGSGNADENDGMNDGMKDGAADGDMAYDGMNGINDGADAADADAGNAIVADVPEVLADGHGGDTGWDEPDDLIDMMENEVHAPGGMNTGRGGSADAGVSVSVRNGSQVGTSDGQTKDENGAGAGDNKEMGSGVKVGSQDGDIKDGGGTGAVVSENMGIAANVGNPDGEIEDGDGAVAGANKNIGNGIKFGGAGGEAKGEDGAGAGAGAGVRESVGNEVKVDSQDGEIKDGDGAGDAQKISQIVIEEG